MLTSTCRACAQIILDRYHKQIGARWQEASILGVLKDLLHPHNTERLQRAGVHFTVRWLAVMRAGISTAALKHLRSMLLVAPPETGPDHLPIIPAVAPLGPTQRRTVLLTAVLTEITSAAADASTVEQGVATFFFLHTLCVRQCYTYLFPSLCDRRGIHEAIASDGAPLARMPSADARELLDDLVEEEDVMTGTPSPSTMLRAHTDGSPDLPESPVSAVGSMCESYRAPDGECVDAVARWYASLFLSSHPTAQAVCHGLTQARAHLRLVLDVFAASLSGPDPDSDLELSRILETNCAVFTVFHEWGNKRVKWRSDVTAGASSPSSTCSPTPSPADGDAASKDASPNEPRKPSRGFWAVGVTLAAIVHECQALAARCSKPVPNTLLLSNATELSKLHGAITRALDLSLSARWSETLDLNDWAALIGDVTAVYQRLILQQYAVAGVGDPSVLMMPLIEVVRRVCSVDAPPGRVQPTVPVARSVSGHPAAGGRMSRGGSGGDPSGKPGLETNSALWRATVRQVLSTLFFGWAYFAKLSPDEARLHTDEIASLSAPCLRALDATRLPPGEAMASWWMMLKAVTDVVRSLPPPSSRTRE